MGCGGDDDDGGEEDDDDHDSDKKTAEDHDPNSSFLMPALGNTWAHCVNTRITLQWPMGAQYRTINIVKSPLSGYFSTM